MKHPALFLLVAAALSGCVCNSQENGAVVIQYKRLFEVGRHAEYDGNIKIAEDTYCWLIGRGSHYGEYGLAMLLLKLYPDREKEAVRLLLSCAESSSLVPGQHPDSAMNLAFSIAAMNKLSCIAEFELGRHDVAALLRCVMADIGTREVREWVEKMKLDADSVAIYREVILAVEANKQSHGHAEACDWNEVYRIFLNEDPDYVVSKQKGMTEWAK